MWIQILLLIGDDDDHAHPTSSHNDDVPDLSIIPEMLYWSFESKNTAVGRQKQAPFIAGASG